MGSVLYTPAKLNCQGETVLTLVVVDEPKLNLLPPLVEVILPLGVFLPLLRTTTELPSSSSSRPCLVPVEFEVVEGSSLESSLKDSLDVEALLGPLRFLIVNFGVESSDISFGRWSRDVEK